MKKVFSSVYMYLYFALLACLVNAGIAMMADGMTNPHYTETEILLRLPQSFFWDFSPNK